MSKGLLFVAAAAAGALAVPALTGGPDPQPESVAKRGAEPVVERLQLAGQGKPVAYRAAELDAGDAEGEFLVVQDGKVVGVVDEAALPPFVRIVDLGDAKIMPGLWAVDSTLAGVQGQGDHSLGAHRRAFDEYDAYADMQYALERGITAVYLSPDRSRLIGGRGALVKTAGENRVITEAYDLRVSLTRDALNPPDFFRPPIPPTSENPLVVAEPQAPTSRAGAMLALREAGAAALAGGEGFDASRDALAAYLAGDDPLRVAVDTTGEALSAIELAREWNKALVLDGLSQADAAAVVAASADLDVRYLLEVPLFAGADDLPGDLVDLAEAYAIYREAEGQVGVKPGGRSDWTWIAEAAAVVGGTPVRGGLGVGDDADFVVYEGDASAPAVHAVYIDGARVWKRGDGETSPTAAESDAVVVRAGTLWPGDGPPMTGGVEVLLRDGRIVAVGPTVGRPAGARVVDAGADAHLAPGYIDARGFLGLGTGNVDPRADLSALADGSLLRDSWAQVARGGVTTMVLGGTVIPPQGARAAVVKTAAAPGARGITDRHVVFFDGGNGDPATAGEQLRGQLQRGKGYAAKWEKYRDERAKYDSEKGGKDDGARAESERELRLRMAQGSAPAKPEKETEEEGPKPVVEEEVVEVDPINGLWAATIEHEMLPEPIQVQMRLAHEGSRLTAIFSSPDDPSGETLELEGTYEGNEIRIELTTDFGTVQFVGRITAPDVMECNVELSGIGAADFVAERIEVGAAAAAPVKRRRVKDDGPQPPPTDWRMEGMRALFEGRAVAVVAADSAEDIRLALEIFGSFELPVHVLGGAEAEAAAGALQAAGAGVIVDRQLLTRDGALERVPAAELRAAGLRTAFQSGAREGARNLPQAVAMAAHRGLGQSQALRALTADAADMLGIGDRVGRVAPGLDGDLLVLSGPPLTLGTRVLRVFVDGQEVPQE